MQILTKDYFIQKDAAACAIKVWAQLFNAQYNVIEQHEEKTNNEYDVVEQHEGKINNEIDDGDTIQNCTQDNTEKEIDRDTPTHETEYTQTSNNGCSIYLIAILIIYLLFYHPGVILAVLIPLAVLYVLYAIVIVIWEIIKSF